MKVAYTEPNGRCIFASSGTVKINYLVGDLNEIRHHFYPCLESHSQFSKHHIFRALETDVNGSATIMSQFTFITFCYPYLGSHERKELYISFL
jgi:hypothetical protein